MTADVESLVAHQYHQPGDERRGGAGVAPVQSAMIAALAQDVAHYSAPRAGQDEGDPEQQHAVDVGEVVRG